MPRFVYITSLHTTTFVRKCSARIQRTFCGYSIYSVFIQSRASKCVDDKHDWKKQGKGISKRHASPRSFALPRSCPMQQEY